jgi:hypothetical protein
MSDISEQILKEKPCNDCIGARKDLFCTLPCRLYDGWINNHNICECELDNEQYKFIIEGKKIYFDKK